MIPAREPPIPAPEPLIPTPATFPNPVFGSPMHSGGGCVLRGTMDSLRGGPACPRPWSFRPKGETGTHDRIWRNGRALSRFSHRPHRAARRRPARCARAGGRTRRRGRGVPPNGHGGGPRESRRRDEHVSSPNAANPSGRGPSGAVAARPSPTHASLNGRGQAGS
eukprot:gene23277-biopygen13361